MTPEELLHRIGLLTESAGREHVDRDSLADSAGLDDDAIGKLLEELVELGLITGYEPAESRGPVAAIRLTHPGRQAFQASADAEDSYLGFEISSAAVPRTGSAEGRRYIVTNRGDQLLELDFGITYSGAASYGRPPAELARELGAHYLRGILALGDFEVGGTLRKTITSAEETDAPALTDEQVETRVLSALQELIRSEARSSGIPHLDVDGVALVLEVDVERIELALLNLELLGQVNANAATFGRGMQRGACRITATGMERLRSIPPQAPAEQNPGPAERNEPLHVFVSYSHDSAEHDERVLTLAGQLRAMGVATELDQYEPAPEEGWPRWMANMINRAHIVLVVCSETYHRRVTGQEEDGRGLGATYEGTLINQEVYETPGRNSKFLPVIFEATDEPFIPAWLRPYTRYDLSQPNGYENLYRSITQQPRIERPVIGELVEMPPLHSTPASAQALEQDPPWHVDVCFRWDHGGGPNRYVVSWAPERGFFPLDDADSTLESAGGLVAPADLPLEDGIGVTYMPGRFLHFEFSEPALPVTAKLHTPVTAHEPHERGGGARQYLSFKLDRVAELS